jgi:hypothetical protein
MDNFRPSSSRVEVEVSTVSVPSDVTNDIPRRLVPSIANTMISSSSLVFTCQWTQAVDYLSSFGLFDRILLLHGLLPPMVFHTAGAPF